METIHFRKEICYQHSMIRLPMVPLPVLLLTLSLAPALPLHALPAAGDKGTAAEPKLPGSTRQLSEYLPNTVWDLKGGGVFRFRGDGTMVMPWHDFKWKATGPRTAEMFTPDWNFKVNFSEDMKSVTVPDRWEGQMVRRVSSVMDDKKLDALLTTGSWSRGTGDAGQALTFDKHGKLLSTDTETAWKTWEVHQGLVILKGQRDGKPMQEEYTLPADTKPLTLKNVNGKDNDPKLTQK